jgi:hypothetical protein
MKRIALFLLVFCAVAVADPTPAEREAAAKKLEQLDKIIAAKQAELDKLKAQREEVAAKSSGVVKAAPASKSSPLMFEQLLKAIPESLFPPEAQRNDPAAYTEVRVSSMNDELLKLARAYPPKRVLIHVKLTSLPTKPEEVSQPAEARPVVVIRRELSQAEADHETIAQIAAADAARPRFQMHASPIGAVEYAKIKWDVDVATRFEDDKAKELIDLKIGDTVDIEGVLTVAITNGLSAGFRFENCALVKSPK